MDIFGTQSVPLERSYKLALFFLPTRGSAGTISRIQQALFPIILYVLAGHFVGRNGNGEKSAFQRND
jgi:hypothetical protein